MLKAYSIYNMFSLIITNYVKKEGIKWYEIMSVVFWEKIFLDPHVYYAGNTKAKVYWVVSLIRLQFTL